MRVKTCALTYVGGFALIEVLAALALIGVFYALFSVNLDARSRAVNFAAVTMQARLWADDAEVNRQRGALAPGVGTAQAPTPFGGSYRVTASEHTATVSFDLPFAVHGGGVFVARDDGGGTLHIMPSVFVPTAPMRDKVGLYKERVR